MLLHHFKMNKFIFLVCVCPWIFTVQAINCQAQNKVSSADDILINCSLILDEPFLVHNIFPNTIYKLQVLNISENIRYVIFQAHSQANKLLMSYQLHVKNLQITNETYVEGKDIGLVVLLEPDHTSAEVYLQSLSSTDFLLVAQGYGSSDPVPGGCNMEFDVEISPYLLMNYDISKTQVKYQRASIINSRNSSQQSCDDSINLLYYEVYVYFMEENNCSQNLYFDSLKKMYSFNSIQQNALKIIPSRIQTPLLVEIPTFRRLGTVFNIVVHAVSHNQTHSVAYIPVVSYGCNLSPVSGSNSCTNILSVIEWLLACFGAGIGIFLCFVGHRFFKTSMVCFGFSSVAVISYILLARFSYLSYNNIVLFTIALGAVGGVGWIVFWYWMGSPLLSLTLVGCNLGFVIASIIFFTPLGKIDVFSYDLNYWLLFSCIILLIHVICINFAQKYHIISCAIIGSFGLIVLLDRYSAGTLTYIILNVLRRATDPSFNTVILVVPFQITDIILSCTWALLAGLGIIIQLVREKRKPPFPVSPRHVQRLSRISSSSPSSALPANETDVWHCSFPSTSDIASPEQKPLLGRSNVPENRVKNRDYSSIKDEERPLPYT